MALPAAANACGHVRWAIKTGTDRDASEVTLSDVVPATVEDFSSMSTPAHVPLHHRVKPVEVSVYYVKATLVKYRLQKNGDYRLVVRGLHGQTMIADIPAPRCVGAGSPFAPDIAKARREFSARYKATDSFQHAGIPVTLTGVGFFDPRHGRRGVAANAVELHPVLDIQFRG